MESIAADSSRGNCCVGGVPKHYYITEMTRVKMTKKPTRASNATVSELLMPGLVIITLATIYFGMWAMYISLASIVACVSFDLLAQLLFKKERKKIDWSSVLSGMIIAFLLPPNAPLHFCFIGAAFAMLVVKHPFGGYGQNVFNPAAGGLAFLAVSYPQQFFDYSVSPTNSNLKDVLTRLKGWNVIKTDKFHVLIGNQPGPLGSTQILLLIVCLLYLLQRGTISKYITWPFFSTCALVVLLFPRTGQRWDSLFFEFSSGMLLFAGIFVLTDPVTAPKFKSSQVIYGIFSGLLVMLFRYMGKPPEGVVFAVLIANSTTKILDALAKSATKMMNAQVQSPQNPQPGG
ncbi:MAG: RnfABCDGE type electron transport complex subunit D [Oscillospiraceae bacterium]|jgi:electron transport complex protein RnfD|nr:RnfABCDGE type electron transport complex subunit D [Oscillospiraceae bacterium]